MSQPIVRIHDGTLKGTVGTNIDGENFLKFVGIPYGKPPVAKLRFMPPQPVDPWTGIRDATIVGSSSISRYEVTQEIVGSEDCLFVNVFTKKLPRPGSKLKPVMVYIHGGALAFGSSTPSLYGPEFLIIKDIVFVSFNYRLGVLGFLAFDDQTLGVTGNMGLKDQRLALQWVQKNIASFNGDPNNVTIFGESAGSGSVHAHILSPGSRGLFHKAILQSGSVLHSGFWGMKNNARKLLKELGRPANSEKEALDVLKRLPAMEIFNAQDKIGHAHVVYPSFERDFAAVIETPNNTAFFSKSPLEIMREGSYNKVPIIMGYTDTEGILLEANNRFNPETRKRMFNIGTEQYIPRELNIKEGSKDSEKVIQILDKLYSKSSNEYDVYTDSYFLVGIIETIRMFLRTSNKPIYCYRLSLDGKRNFLKLLIRCNKPGTAHADDLGYLFHSDFIPDSNPGSKDDKAVRNLVELWTNFAEYGEPTPNNKLNVLWKQVENVENIKVLDIGEELVFKDIPERNRLEVWWDILKTWPYVRIN